MSMSENMVYALEMLRESVDGCHSAGEISDDQYGDMLCIVERGAEALEVMEPPDERGYRDYVVFWTYLGNYANQARTVRARGIVEAIELGSFYDPRTASKSGKHHMRFLVFQVGAGLVHDGTIFDAEEATDA